MLIIKIFPSLRFLTRLYFKDIEVTSDSSVVDTPNQIIGQGQNKKILLHIGKRKIKPKLDWPQSQYIAEYTPASIYNMSKKVK